MSRDKQTVRHTCTGQAVLVSVTAADSRKLAIPPIGFSGTEGERPWHFHPSGLVVQRGRDPSQRLRPVSLDSRRSVGVSEFLRVFQVWMSVPVMDDTYEGSPCAATPGTKWELGVPWPALTALSHCFFLRVCWCPLPAVVRNEWWQVVLGERASGSRCSVAGRIRLT